MHALLQHIEQELSRVFNKPVRGTQHEQVFGGDINKTFRLQTNIGSFFLKLNEESLNDMFEKEFEGLQLLHQTNSINIPKPIVHGKFNEQIFLVTAFIQKGKPAKGFWKIFAYQLAALHKTKHPRFGLSTNNYIGSLVQQNDFADTWAEFYAHQRILPLAHKAFDQQKLSASEITQIENIGKRLHNLFPTEKPSLVHGDLWNGNFMSDENGQPVIYDPAVYYGHREMDIAMSLLFGGFDAGFYECYNEAFPLPNDWKERVKLCQLYPLLVHLILFGGGYYGSVKSIINQYK